ncbi:MAG: carboxymuconolactone decarboxylase family protein [Phycisphaerae bacterium]|jgi:4-carboxymuconolactone decarboxylase|nr:carboxymuconolactone decarboxylase family protein [Phycisphaerae bacterium]
MPRQSKPRSSSKSASEPAKPSARAAASASPKAPALGALGAAGASKIPNTFKTFIAKYPELGAAHEKVAGAVERAGPLDAKTLALVKIGIALGAGLESALRSHVRRAMQQGATIVEIEQAILLGMNTVGFPRTVAAWSWAHQQFAKGS